MSCDSRMNEETSGHCEAGMVGRTGLTLYSGSVWPSTVLPSCEFCCADIYRSPALGDSWAENPEGAGFQISVIYHCTITTILKNGALKNI